MVKGIAIAAVLAATLAGQASFARSSSGASAAGASAAAAAMFMASAAASRASESAAAAASTAGAKTCGSCHEELFPLRKIKEKGMFSDDPSEWSSAFLFADDYVTYTVLERRIGDIRRVYVVKQKYVPNRYLLPSSSKNNPHHVLD